MIVWYVDSLARVPRNPAERVIVRVIVVVFLPLLDRIASRGLTLAGDALAIGSFLTRRIAVVVGGKDKATYREDGWAM